MCVDCVKDPGKKVGTRLGRQTALTKFVSHVVLDNPESRSRKESHWFSPSHPLMCVCPGGSLLIPRVSLFTSPLISVLTIARDTKFPKTTLLLLLEIIHYSNVNWPIIIKSQFLGDLL